MGRLEVVKELMAIMESPPTETTTQEPNLWCEQWNKFMWGNQYELDQAESIAVLQAKASAGISGKGFQLGKGKCHWSNMAIHTNYYEPYPFNLTPISVEKIFFSWDEMCDKFRVPEQKVGNYAIATVRGAFWPTACAPDRNATSSSAESLSRSACSFLPTAARHRQGQRSRGKAPKNARTSK